MIATVYGKVEVPEWASYGRETCWLCAYYVGDGRDMRIGYLLLRRTAWNHPDLKYRVTLHDWNGEILAGAWDATVRDAWHEFWHSIRLQHSVKAYLRRGEGDNAE